MTHYAMDDPSVAELVRKNPDLAPPGYTRRGLSLLPSLATGASCQQNKVCEIINNTRKYINDRIDTDVPLTREYLEFYDLTISLILSYSDPRAIITITEMAWEVCQKHSIPISDEQFTRLVDYSLGFNYVSQKEVAYYIVQFSKLLRSPVDDMDFIIMCLFVCTLNHDKLDNSLMKGAYSILTCIRYSSLLNPGRLSQSHITALYRKIEAEINESENIDHYMQTISTYAMTTALVLFLKLDQLAHVHNLDDLKPVTSELARLTHSIIDRMKV